MGELTGLEVDRVDGVDRPATKRQFLIVKAEGDPAGAAAGEGDGVAQAKKLIAAAARALGGVHASKSEFPADVADALNELAELAAVPAETRFTKAAAPAAPAAGQAIDPDAFALTIAKAVGAEVKKALSEEVAKAVATDDETVVGTGEPIETSGAVRETITTTTAAPPPSAQPAGQTPITKSAGPRKNGDGLFGNLVFGK